MSLHEDEDNQAGMKPMLEVPLEEADHEATGIIPAHDDLRDCNESRRSTSQTSKVN